jgi:hypothetical protein
MDGRNRARLLSVLSDFGYGELVVRYWRRHRVEVEADIESWAQTVRALIDCGHKREVRELAAGCLDRPGIAMWNVANYVEALTGIVRDLRAIRSACAQALAELPHDHTARYLAHIEAEASALLEDTEGFFVSWNEHRAYFDGNLAEGEWFKASRRNLLEDVPRMAQLLEGNHRWNCKMMRWRLRWGHVKRALRASSVVRAMRGIPPVVWWLLIVGTLAILVNL